MGKPIDKISQRQELSLPIALEAANAQYDKLVSHCTELKLCPRDISRQCVKFGTLLFGHSPQLAAVWGLSHIGDAYYTPAVSTVFPNNREIRESVPKAIHPLVFQYNEQDAQAYLNAEQTQNHAKEEKQRVIEKIQAQILGKAQQVFGYFAPNQEWTPEMMQHFVSVITDGGRILALGDQGGTDGAWISIGKQFCNSIATQNAIPPQFRLALGIDVGSTNNKIREEGYEGLKQLRKDNPDTSEKGIPEAYRLAYTHLVIEALDQLNTRLIQYEDFDGAEAQNLLKWTGDRQREGEFHTAFFNDDIQGAGAVVEAAIEGLEQIRRVNITHSLFFFVGAGGMSSGLAEQLAKRYPDLKDKKRWFFRDIHGPLFKGRSEYMEKPSRENPDAIEQFQENLGLCMSEEQIETLKRYAISKKKNPLEMTLADVVECFKSELGENGAIFLIGASSSPGHITEELIGSAHETAKSKATTDNINQPTVVIMPLSNPATKSEIVPAEIASALNKNGGTLEDGTTADEYFQEYIDRIMHKTENRAVFISGTKLQTQQGAEYVTNQANNILLFPALTLACQLGNFSRITENMWQTGTHALIQYQKDHPDETGLSVIPSTDHLVDITEYVAEQILIQGVKDHAVKEGGALQQVSEAELTDGSFSRFFQDSIEFLRRGADYPPDPVQRAIFMDMFGGYTENHLPSEGEIEEWIN